MKCSLIAMDLDGTALLDDSRSFTPRLHAALAEAHRRGIAVLPVTGRQYELLPPAVHTGAAWEDLCVLCNGGQVRRLASGELLCSTPLPPEALPALLDAAAGLHIPVEFSIDSRLYLTPESKAQVDAWPQGTSQFHVSTVLPQRGVVVPTLEGLWRTHAVEKVNLMCIPPEARAPLEAALASLPLSGVWSAQYAMEVSHRDATKARGLQWVCRRLGVPLEQVLALGDSGNDLSMLRAAGLGVAMGNAPREVRDAADAVTDTNLRDGAALAIERYAL